MRIDSALPLHIARAYALKPAALAQSPQPSAGSSPLVAGRVAGPVNFSASTPVQPPTNVLQMYNRAADRVEAAVAIQIGKSLDVRG